jgi:hypothetical protein
MEIYNGNPLIPTKMDDLGVPPWIGNLQMGIFHEPKKNV